MDDLKAAPPASAPDVRRRSTARRRLLLTVSALLLMITATTVTLYREESSPRWRLVWSDDFKGSSLDRSKWTAEDHSTFGDGNKELACLMSRSANVWVAGGMLTLRAIRESAPVICGEADSRFPKGRSYTSGMLSTQGKASWHQGRFEVRAKLPLAAGSSKGLWSAFWLRPANGPGDGELDVMEAIGTADSHDPEASAVHQTVWYDQRGAFPKESNDVEVDGGPAAGFHTYGVEWTDGRIRWYVDGKSTFERDRSSAAWIDKAFAGDFYIRLNLAVGGTFPGTPDAATGFPADMVVDWVKVYQRR